MEHDADDVLADVVNITLDRRHDDLALGARAGFLCGFDIGDEVRDGFFHDPRRFYDLRQEHLARSEQVADDVHAVHQRAFDDFDGARKQLAAFLCVIDDIHVDAFDQRMFQPLGHMPTAPFLRGLFLRHVGATKLFGESDKSFGRRLVVVTRRPIEDHVFARFTQYRVNRVVNVELPRVDDAHVHARRDRVIEKDRVHRAAHRFVATETKTQIGQAARDVNMRACCANFDAGFDEIDGVIVVLFDTRCHGEYIGIENDIFRRKADPHQQLVSALADFNLAVFGIRLPDFIERHHDNRCAVVHDLLRLRQKLRFAFLHADRIDDWLAADAFHTGFDHRPFRTVDHKRHAGDVGFGRDQLDEGFHRDE